MCCKVSVSKSFILLIAGLSFACSDKGPAGSESESSISDLKKTAVYYCPSESIENTGGLYPYKPLNGRSNLADSTEDNLCLIKTDLPARADSVLLSAVHEQFSIYADNKLIYGTEDLSEEQNGDHGLKYVIKKLPPGTDEIVVKIYSDNGVSLGIKGYFKAGRYNDLKDILVYDSLYEASLISVLLFIALMQLIVGIIFRYNLQIYVLALVSLATAGWIFSLSAVTYFTGPPSHITLILWNLSAYISFIGAQVYFWLFTGSRIIRNLVYFSILFVSAILLIEGIVISSVLVALFNLYMLLTLSVLLYFWGKTLKKEKLFNRQYIVIFIVIFILVAYQIMHFIGTVIIPVHTYPPVIILMIILLTLPVFQKQRRYRFEYYRLSRELETRNLKLLTERLKPHFLMNTFSLLKRSIKNSTENTDEILDDLIDMYRFILNNINKDAVKFSEELNFIDSYYNIMDKRSDQHFTLKYEIDDSLRNMILPLFSLQIPVENAIVHGFSDSTTIESILIKAEKSENAVKISVENTGKPVKTSISSDTLADLKKRLKQLYVNSEINLGPSHSEGYATQFLITVYNEKVE